MSWRDRIKVHPAADLFPMMSEAELAELGEDIRQNGLKQPVAFYQDEGFARGATMQLIDGRNRLEAMERVGILDHDALGEIFDRGKMVSGDETSPEAYVVSVNIRRRHLTAEQKREVIARVLKAQPERSDRAIGKLAQADHKTVATVRSEIEGRGEIPHVDARTDSLGRQQPASKTSAAPQFLTRESKAPQPLESVVSLEKWRTLDDATKAALLSPDPSLVTIPRFNKQENDAIEWAKWSWNPITGCLHDCPYCYARDIANQPKMGEAYPYRFAPALRPRALLTPHIMRVPLDADGDTRFRNVFTCSMADMFGRWVPPEWIEAVFTAIRAAPEWNFLCLTKFPKRMAEFEVPPNAWMGTTVDLQARVAAAEAAFAKVQSKVKWLSVEPMIEPLCFKHLDRFNWIVIGGASRLENTPEWHPPFEWVVDLVQQAREAGLKVYFKTNLLHSRILELPFDAPIAADPIEAPAVFHYLSGKTPAEQQP